jgi:hypothetical protein
MAGVGVTGGAAGAGGGVDGVEAGGGAERAGAEGGFASAGIEVGAAAGVETGWGAGWRLWFRGVGSRWTGEVTLLQCDGVVPADEAREGAEGVVELCREKGEEVPLEHRDLAGECRRRGGDRDRERRGVERGERGRWS